MRNYIVKLFALNYVVDIFGINLRWVRAANVIFPLFCIAGSLTAIDNWLRFPFYIILACAIWLGFGYFKFSPLNWEKDNKFMDEVQRWQFNVANESTYKFPSQLNALWIALVNPIFVLISLFIIFYGN